MKLEIVLWLVIALLVGMCLGAAIMLAAVEKQPDCSFQHTAGNWQPACAHVH